MLYCSPSQNILLPLDSFRLVQSRQTPGESRCSVAATLRSVAATCGRPDPRRPSTRHKKHALSLKALWLGDFSSAFCHSIGTDYPGMCMLGSCLKMTSYDIFIHCPNAETNLSELTSMTPSVMMLAEECRSQLPL